MRCAVIVCLCLVLMASATHANFYGKRAMEGKSLQDLISDMRRQAAGGAEEVVAQIELILKEYRATHPARVLRHAETDN